MSATAQGPANLDEISKIVNGFNRFVQSAELEKQAINLSEKGGYRVLVPVSAFDHQKRTLNVPAPASPCLMNQFLCVVLKMGGYHVLVPVSLPPSLQQLTQPVIARSDGVLALLASGAFSSLHLPLSPDSSVIPTEGLLQIRDNI